MKQYRLIEAAWRDDPDPVYFLEVEQGGFVPVLPFEGATDSDVHEFYQSQCVGSHRPLLVAERLIFMRYSIIGQTVIE